jgi:hypothetical protein
VRRQRKQTNKNNVNDKRFAQNRNDYSVGDVKVRLNQLRI